MPSRTDEELREASDHLFYEYEMLCATTDRLARGEPDTAVRNALLESFCVHARNVLCFLFEKPRYPDDVSARDYLVDSAAWYGRKPISLEAVYRGVSKRAAHLTYARLAVTPEDKPWDHAQIALEIGQVLKRATKSRRAGSGRGGTCSRLPGFSAPLSRTPSTG